MTSLLKGQISFTFFELRKLVASFERSAGSHFRSHAEEVAIYQLVDHLGSLAVPTLLRRLFQSEAEAHWAGELLLRLADSDDSGLMRRRICDALLSERGQCALPPPCRAVVEDVLNELEEEVPWLSPSGDASAQHALCDLAACIDSRAALARTADTLIADLPAQEIIEFTEDFTTPHSEIALCLIDELINRDDLDEETKSALRQIGASAEAACGSTRQEAVERLAPGPKKPGLRIAKHPRGQTALVAYAKSDIDGLKLYRALSFQLDERGCLQHCQYLEQVPRSMIDSLFLRPLAEAGYELFPAAPGTVHQLATSATRLRLSAGNKIPRAYYLGRDLLGLSSAPLVTPSEEAVRKSRDAALLARGTNLLRRGRASLARDLLMQYANKHPEDSEAQATLGSCLLESGDPRAARTYFRRACALAPNVGRYHWNRAALAHKEGRIGDCFLAMQDYLGCSDQSDQSKRNIARELVANYDQRSRDKPPSHSDKKDK